MNKLSCLIVMFITLVPVLLFSQDSGPFKRNEIKLNGGYLVLGYLEISYECALNDESSVGFSTGMSIDKDIDYNFGFMPYYRVYFGKNPQQDFLRKVTSPYFHRRKGTTILTGSINLKLIQIL